MPRLSDTQLAQVEQALLEGATANGFVGELWTLERVATVIDRWVKQDWPRIKQTPNGAEPVWSSSTRARSA